MKKKLIIALIILVIAAVTTLVVTKYMPTQIALINFQDGQLAEINKVNKNNMIKITSFDKEDELDGLENYDVIYTFHLGMVNEVQKANIDKALDGGAKIYMHASTSPEHNLNNLTEEEEKYVKGYLENGGMKNIQYLLNYSRKALAGSSLFTDDIQEPIEFPKNVFYRIGDEDFFEKAEEYWTYYKGASLYKEGGKTVAIVNTSADPQTVFRSYQDSLIVKLERLGHNVVALAGFKERLNMLKAVSPDIVLFFAHGRLLFNQGDAAVDWLKEQNIPLLNPQLVYQNYDEWMADQQGMTGGLMGQNLVVPELDGAIYPYAIAAKYKNEEGFYTYKAIPGKVERFVEITDRFLKLKEIPNKDKRICIYYYKGAGQNAMVAENLEVGSSLLSLLNHLKAEGFDTGDKHPATEDELLERIQKEGPVYGDYAQGSFDKYVEAGGPDLIPASTYESWVKSELDPDSYKEVEKLHGKAPGTYFSTTVNDTAMIAVPRVQFGNVVLLPVLPSALGESEYKMIHGVKKAPPHAYIASYLWSRMAFKAHVVCHFGTHGNLEFTPWKQVALSLQDWPEALIAPLPHVYIYSINNIGEAMMAKRRIYAALVSHLTSALDESQLYGDLEDLQDYVGKVEETADEAFANEYKKKIRVLLDSTGVAKDLELTAQEVAELDDETIKAIDHYLFHLSAEKIDIGLHTFGQPFSGDEIEKTARMMSVDPVANSLMEVDKLYTPVSEDQSKDEKQKQLVKYRNQSLTIIDKVLAGADPLSFMKHHQLAELNALHARFSNEKKEEMVYDRKTHTMVPKSSLEKPAKKKEVKRDEHGEELVYDRETHKMVPKSSLKTAEAKKEVKRDANGEELVYDHKTHKMVPKSSLKTSDDNKEEKEELVYDHETHLPDGKAGKMVPKNKKHQAKPTDDELQAKKRYSTLSLLKENLLAITKYKANLNASFDAELNGYVTGVTGGYIAPSSGGDPAVNPNAVPTGRNLYSINAESTPTKEAWNIGKNLGDLLLQKHIAKHGDYPKKVAFTLWSSEFIRNKGLNIAQAMYLLGVEPVWNASGRVHDVKLIPLKELGRPRIDVIVQTSGQFRDIAASRLSLINKAVMLVASDEEEEYTNYVKEGSQLAEQAMKENGISPEKARKLAYKRVFGGVNGNYGTAIMGMVEKGDAWEDEKEIAGQYLKNMGALYDDDFWSVYEEGVFEAMMVNTEAIVHPRSSNVTGPISLDHVYEFMGGLTLTIRNVTGNDPDGYFNDYRNKYNPNVQALKEAIWAETRTHLFNPKYIEAKLEEGATAAEGFAENFRDTYGWNVMKPDAIDKEIWEGYYDIYVKDKLELGTVDFFKKKNPYALQEMTAVMLETIRKGYWKPSDAVVKEIANMHAELVKDHKAGCSGFVCDNAKLKEMIQDLLGGELKETYQQEIAEVRTGDAGKKGEEGVVLEKEEDKSLAEMMEENKSAVISLAIAILLIGGFVTWGIIRRRRNS